MENSKKKISLEEYCKKNNLEYLLQEWNYEKNAGVIPSEVSYGSHKKVWWKQEIDGITFEWETVIKDRTLSRYGNPYLSSQKILKGYNDLATKYPGLLEEWDFEKNKELTPYELGAFSSKRVYWNGKCGHKWSAKVSARARGDRCPICSNELRTSFPEQAISFYLSKFYCDIVNNERYILNGKELDIYIPSENIGIEYDGYRHNSIDGVKKDIIKDDLCKKKGIKLIRIREKMTPELKYSICFLRKDLSVNALNNVICQLFDYLNLSVDIDVERDEGLIYNQFICSIKENNLEKKYPQIAKEWNYEKNGVLTPNMFMPSSGKAVWWKQEIDGTVFEWKAKISNRTTKKSDNPFTAKYHTEVKAGYNDLETKNPEIAKEWNYEKNGDLKPSMVTPYSSIKVWWKQEIDGITFEWESTVANRTSGWGNPYIHGHKVKKGYNDLSTKCPEIAKDWDYEKNGDLKPNEVGFSSHKKVWWKQVIDGKTMCWEDTINHRINGANNPYIMGRKLLQGYNDLETKEPEIAKEWNYEKNDGVRPNEVRSNSTVKVWWKCKCGYEWKASVYNRSLGKCNCQVCNKR